MSYGRAYAFSTLAVVAALALPAAGQSVISTRSGVIHFFEGAVYLGDQPLEPHLGKFPSMGERAELRTAQGRAEVLLTPGVFLRIGERSAIRMLANALSDTRVELLEGSAIVDSEEPSSGTSVRLIYKDWNVRFLQKGIYRIDSEPPRLWVHQGEAEVSAGAAGEPISVEQGMDLPLAAVLVPEGSSEGPRDELSNWAEGRNQSISADNAIAANIEDPASTNRSTLGLDNFTYFPMLGLSPPGLGLSGQYGSLYPYQPGFNSIYLPGYTRAPLFWGLAPGGFRGYPYSPTQRFGVRPGAGAAGPAPHAPFPRPTPVHTMPHGGIRVGGHR
jgi:hypothetical protein